MYSIKAIIKWPQFYQFKHAAQKRFNKNLTTVCVCYIFVDCIPYSSVDYTATDAKHKVLLFVIIDNYS